MTPTERNHAEGRCCGDGDGEPDHEPANGLTHYPTDRVHYPLTSCEDQRIREITPRQMGHDWWDCDSRYLTPCLGCQSTNTARHNCVNGDPMPEGGMTRRYGQLLAHVWLADRICRVRCSCACRAVDPWEESEECAGATQPSLFAGVA